MNPRRFSYLMIFLVVLLLMAVIGATAAGDMLLRNQSDKLSNLKAQDQVIKEQEVSLAQAKSDIQKYTQLDEIAKSVVPQDKDQAKTVREINAIAAESGISLQQISFDTSNLGLPAASGSAKNSQSLSQVKPVEGIKGVYSLEVTVSSGESNPVSYYRFLNFLEKLEANRRTAHVSTISVTPSEKNRGDVTFSLVLNAYLKP